MSNNENDHLAPSALDDGPHEYYVYAWMRPSGEPFYIGKGRGGRSQATHGRNSIFNRIVEKIRKSGAEPTVVRIHENLTEAEAFSREQSEIAKYGRLNNKTGILANLTDGGEGSSGYSPSIEAREKISKAMLGREVTEAHRTRLSISLTGMKRSAETKEKISIVHKGKVISDAHRAQIVEASKASRPRSLFKGVSKVNNGTWAARIYIDGKPHNLGSFLTPSEAARAYDHAAYCALGTDCYLNFPDMVESPAPTGRTISQAKRNAAPKVGFKGVCFRAATGKWRALIKAHGKQQELGSFQTAEDAARAYDMAAYAAWGRDCYLNFRDSLPANDNHDTDEDDNTPADQAA